MFLRSLLIASVLCILCGSVLQHSNGDDFVDFESTIAPIFARHCLECHSSGNAEGGLDLSSRKGWQTGGESGPVHNADEALAGLMWSYVSDDSMPKDRASLSAEEKAAIRQWLVADASWTMEQIDPYAYADNRRAGYQWWSLQRVVRPQVPSLENNWQVRSPIDSFIHQSLQAKGLTPATQADRRTLIRRLYFDLIGLPPTPQQIAEFIDDAADDAYDRLVERLLASPHYGERWARHWLDVVRFGETQGFERNLIRENAWRYRDWVVRAFNDDLPYDDFIRYQIAGDVIAPDDYDAVIATGYHVCGTWDQVGHIEGSPTMRQAARWDHLEDLVGTLGQSFLGITLHCARCHDHKFDPISQKDYYQIASLLGGVTQEKDERSGLKLVMDEERLTRLKSQQQELADKLEAIQHQWREKYAVPKNDTAETDPGLQAFYHFGKVSSNNAPESISNLVDKGAGPPLKRIGDKIWSSGQNAKALNEAIREANSLTISLWLRSSSLNQTGPARILTLSIDTGQRNVTIGQDKDRFDVRLRTTSTDGNGLPSLASPPNSVSITETHLVFTFDAAGTTTLYLNGKRVAEHPTGGSLANWSDDFQLAFGDEVGGQRRWQGDVMAAGVFSRALSASEVQQQFSIGPTVDSPGQWSGGSTIEKLLQHASNREITEFERAKNELDEVESQIQSLRFDGTAHVVVSRQPDIFHVLSRGDMRKPMDEVVPQGVAAISQHGLSSDFGLSRDSPEGERRRMLASWIADPRNPLTARVMANRMWQYHFGAGLVDTPNDFGFNGGRPSHADLLDWLASELMNPQTPIVAGEDLKPWSIKHLHRLIVQSATYRQESRVANLAASELDSDNRLLWRFPLKRLEGEAIRDAALMVSGALNDRVGGPSYRDMQYQFNQNAEFSNPTGEFNAEANRRTIYRLWARSGNHPLLQTFDCPDPSVSVPLRTQTTTPLQALSLLHNTTLENCSKEFAKRVRRESPQDVSFQVRLAYEIAFGRTADHDEVQLAVDFIESVDLEQFCLVLLNSSEFVFVN